MKQCKECNIEKDDSFFLSTRYPSICKDCAIDKRKKRNIALKKKKREVEKQSIPIKNISTIIKEKYNISDDMVDSWIEEACELFYEISSYPKALANTREWLSRKK